MPPVKRAPKKIVPKKAVAKATQLDPETRDSMRARARAMAASINRDKSFGVGTVVPASEALPPPPRLSTGVLSFDVALGGGLPGNQWTEILGMESSGKTSFILKCIAHQQKLNPDFTVAWIAAESWDESLAVMCGVDLEGIFLIEENVMEKAYEAALKYIEGRACDMCVIDSYPALVTEAEDKKEMDGFDPGGGARTTNQFMRKCTKASKRSLIDPDDRPFVGIFVNQWREKIGVMYGDPRTSSGGKGKNYWMYCRIDVKRDEWITNKEKYAVGQVVKLVVMKMKGARPKQVGVADYYFADSGDFHGGEYDVFKAIVNLAVLYDLIERAGNGYRHPDGTFIKSNDLLVTTLSSDLEWREQIEKEVLTIAARGKAPVEMEDDEADVTDIEDAPSAKPRNRRKVV